MNTKANSGLKVKTAIKAGGFRSNHNAAPKAGLRVKSAIKAGGFRSNHNVSVVRSR
jgi:hypothetical protein